MGKEQETLQGICKWAFPIIGHFNTECKWLDFSVDSTTLVYQVLVQFYEPCKKGDLRG